MFDWYRPQKHLRCPVDGHALKEWQGKDGPCGLFVWREGVKHPVDQLVDDEDVRWSVKERERFTLPSNFAIYSYDCPAHQPINAKCSTREGIWISTVIQAPTT